MLTIKVRENGPYKVEAAEGEVRLVDWNGNEYKVDRWPIALCRCGASATKPFCDKSHSKVGFAAAEAAVAGSVDNPAK